MSRLLVIDLHHLGDAVLALPFVRSAQAGGHDVWVLCRPGAADIFAWCLPRDRIVSWNPPWHEDSAGSGLFAGMAECRRVAGGELAPIGLDAAVCVWADPRVHWLMRCACIPERVGFPANASNYYAADFAPRRGSLRAGQIVQAVLGLPPQRQLLTVPIGKASPDQHHFDSWRQIADTLGVPGLRLPLDPPPNAAGWPPPAASAGAEKVLAVAPAARLPSKTWPMRSFAGVARDFLDSHPGWRVQWLLPPEFDAVALPAEAVAIRSASLDDLLGAVASADMLLCNDSLPAHLASLVGTPVVSVFRTGNPAWFAPLGAAARPVFQPPNKTIPVADTDATPSYVDTDGPAPGLVLEVLASLVGESA